MNRRTFLQSTAATVASATLIANQAGADEQTHTFHLKYAPHFGMFRNSAGDDLEDQLQFAADQGFTAWEDNGMMSRPVEDQQRVAAKMEQLGMTMGVIVAYASFDEPTFALRNDDGWDGILGRMEEAVEVAKRVNATWCTVVPGSVDQQGNTGNWNRYGGSRLSEGYQTANVIELLKRCAAVFEPHGLVMVLEPLNWHVNHGGTFLQYSDQAWAICRAVDSPSCKILFDIYHQQITEGNLIPNIDRCWDEIAYFQAGDNPGRKEPGTGEINYRNVFAHIHERAFEGVIGMEHGNSQPGAAGERAVIEAYRQVDSF